MKNIYIYISPTIKNSIYTKFESLISSNLSMALLSGFFSCFSDSSRIAFEGEGSAESRLNKEYKSMEKSKTKKGPPIPLSKQIFLTYAQVHSS